MKHAITICLILNTLCAVARGEINFPLKAIPVDSLYFMDFFWNAVQKQADKTPLTTKTSTPWKIKKMSTKSINTLTSQWNKAISTLNILGEQQGEPPSLEKSIKLFNQSYTLNQLTGNAKYIDIAEHIMLNSILRRWQAEPASAIKDQATMLFRTISQMAFSTSGKDVYINMLIRANAHIKTKQLNIYLQSVNSSPWYNETAITVTNNNSPIQVNDYDSLNVYQRLVHHDSATKADSCQATLHIRIPSWATGKNIFPTYKTSIRHAPIQILVNGIALSHPTMVDGYVIVERKWAPDDIITIKMPTPIMRISHTATPDSTALQRGPFVYYYIGAGDHDVLDPHSAIEQTFSNTDNAVVLSGMLNNSDNRFFCVPCFKSLEKQQIFLPAK